MKKQTVMALLLSMVLSFSTCAPLGSITASGAETGGTAQVAAVQEKASDSEENVEMQEETDTSSQTGTDAEEKTNGTDEVLPEEIQEEDVEETAEEVSSDDREDTAGQKEDADTEAVNGEISGETEAAVPAQEAELSETDTETADSKEDPEAYDETSEQAAETPAEEKTNITSPAHTETVKTDVQNYIPPLSSKDLSKAVEITVGAVKEASIDEKNGYVLYRFIPEETTEYTFFSSGCSSVPCAIMYYSNMSLLDTWDEDEDELNFKYNMTLDEGDTYYFQVGFDGNDTGSYMVHLEKKGLICSVAGDDYIRVSPDEKVTVKVNASSTSDISYQWKDPDNKIIKGAVSFDYTFVPKKTGYYTCHISDRNGNSEILEIFIDIDNDLNIVPEGCEDTNYCEKTAKPKESLTLTAFATAIKTENLSYAWYIRENYYSETLIDGADSASYTISSVESSNTYICKVIDQYGNSAIASFDVTVNNLTAYPEGFEDSSNSYIHTLPNKPCTMKVIATADDPETITYTWYDDNYNLVDGANTDSYTISSVDYSQRWECHVSDAYGNIVYIYFLINVNNLKAYVEGMDESIDYVSLTKAIGSSVTLKVIATADDMSGVTYEWKDPDYNTIEGANSSSFTINSISDAQSGHYNCYISDPYGNNMQVTFFITTLDISNVQTINVGNVREVNVGQDMPCTLFKFTPSSTGEYIISYEDNDAGPIIDIYDELLNTIAEVSYEGDTYYSGMFSAGKTYYIEAGGVAYEGSFKLYLVQKAATSISDAVVTKVVNKTFNGDAQIQKPVVTLNGKTLTEGTDYIISYSNNINAGTATMIITGNGSYTGNAPVKTFTINPASIEKAEVTDIVDKTYNDSEQTQNPVVKLGSTTLTEGTDYTVSYSNNVNAGKAIVTITGKGNYTDSRTSDFTINPASIENVEITGIADKTYNGSEQTQSPVVKAGSATLKENTDYTILYSNNIDAGKVTVTISGKGNYTGTKTSDFTINPASIEKAEVAGIVDKTYNGSEQTQSPVVKVGSTTLKENTDYTISYKNNINAGKATVTITGKGNYTGTVTKQFTISDRISIETAQIDDITGLVYNGKEQKPVPAVKVGSTTLIEGTDYTIESYSNNVNAGTAASVTIKGIGLYTGTVSKIFTIDKAVQNFTVKAAASSIDVGKTTKVTATGAEENPKYTFTSSNVKVAAVNASGTVTGKSAGTVTITVTAAETANYKALSKTVKITVNKVLKKPGNCHFAKWNNSKYTSCRIAWNKVDGAEGYETLLSWTNGSHASRTIVKSNVLYRDCTVHPQHVSQMMVRAFYMSAGKRVFGPWSNVEYITPSPTKLTTKNASSGTNLKMNISWNIIYGCNGYNVFLTTNPNGTWYWNQSTSTKADATSAVINKFRGSKLKKNTRYYVRIVTRRKRNGVFCTVPMPASNTYIGSFIIK